MQVVRQAHGILVLEVQLLLFVSPSDRVRGKGRWHGRGLRYTHPPPTVSPTL